jgi:hypothetical protein
MSDTSTCLREALVERDLLRRRLTQMQEQSNRDEEKRRTIARDLHDALLTIRAQARALGDAQDELARYLHEEQRQQRLTEAHQ